MAGRRSTPTIYGDGNDFHARVGLVRDPARNAREIGLVGLRKLNVAAEEAEDMASSEKSTAAELRLVSADFTMGHKERFEGLFTAESRAAAKQRGIADAVNQLGESYCSETVREIRSNHGWIEDHHGADVELPKTANVKALRKDLRIAIKQLEMETRQATESPTIYVIGKSRKSTEGHGMTCKYGKNDVKWVLPRNCGYD